MFASVLASIRPFSTDSGHVTVQSVPDRLYLMHWDSLDNALYVIVAAKRPVQNLNRGVLYYSL